jgi:hypothetical protein
MMNALLYIDILPITKQLVTCFVFQLLKVRGIPPEIHNLKPAKHGTLLPCVSMPEVMCASPMSHEQKTKYEQCHEEVILSDHNALFFSFPSTSIRIAPSADQRCDVRDSPL